MTDNLPDYTALEPPDEKPPVEYTTHERRADVLQQIVEAGSPFAVNQTELADQYGVHRSTISRDMDRLRESVDELLGRDAKLTTRALYESIIGQLLAESDWKAKKAAWDIVMDWNEWLADIGEQHREPDRSEIDVRSRNAEVSYTIVRGDEKLQGSDGVERGTDAGHLDPEDLGFTSAPTEIAVGGTDAEGGGSS
ncbi:MAG: HTH domain-containing protein [Halovenus sp.]